MNSHDEGCELVRFFRVGLASFNLLVVQEVQASALLGLHTQFLLQPQPQPCWSIRTYRGSISNTHYANTRNTRIYALIWPFSTSIRAYWGSDSSTQYAV